MLSALVQSLVLKLKLVSVAVAAAVIGASGVAAAATVVTVADESTLPAVTSDGTTPTDEATSADDPSEDATDEATDDATDDATDEATDEESDEATEDDTDEATVEAEPTEEAAPVTVEPLFPEQCAAATNHGAYVSYVAKATKGTPDHGALVAAAAASDCGKVADTVSTTEESAPRLKAPKAPKVKAAKAPKVTSHASAKGRGHGKGHAKHGR